MASVDQLPQVAPNYTYKNNYPQHYLKGRVSKTWNSYNQTWYSYDYAGRSEYIVQQLVDADFSTIDDETVKTMEYTYAPLTSVLLKEAYQKNHALEKITQEYTYNSNLQLVTAIAKDETDTVVGEAAFEYYTNGLLKRKELGDNLQGIDYVYTLNGQLKSINHPSLAITNDPGSDGRIGSKHVNFQPDLFGFALDYYQDDYQHTGTNIISSVSNEANGYHNGLIKATRWKIRGENELAGTPLYSQGEIDKEVMYNYTYDNFYRLETATFGIFNNDDGTSGTFTATDDYKVFGASANSGIDYDIIGNITNLKRNGYAASGGLLMDDLVYDYTLGTSQLASITDDGDPTDIYHTDFGTTAADEFMYNSLGQMTASEADGVINMDYYPNGQVKEVTFNGGNTATYFYNERGIKIKSKFIDVGSNHTKYNWYITDASGALRSMHGKTMTTTTANDVEMTSQIVYAGGRLGVLDVETNKLAYEHTDHLGNVRVTFEEKDSVEAPVIIMEDDFETGLDGWTSSANLTNTGGKLDASTELVFPFGIYPTYHVQKTIITEPGQTYNWRFDKSGPGFLLVVNFIDVVSGNKIGEYASSQSTVFQGPEGTFTAISDTTTISIRGSGQGSLLIDNFIIESIPNNLEVTSWSDYYPFGEVMPGRNSNPTGMFGYQGQERVSNATNEVAGSRWYNFNLRMYNPSLGRFNTIDPYSQFNSPYLAMANNPISFVDPDGGLSRYFAWWRSTQQYVKAELWKLDQDKPDILRTTWLRRWLNITGKDSYNGLTLEEAYAHLDGFHGFVLFDNYLSALGDGFKDKPAPGTLNHHVPDHVGPDESNITIDGLLVSGRAFNLFMTNELLASRIDPVLSFSSIPEIQGTFDAIADFYKANGIKYNAKEGRYGRWERSSSFEGGAFTLTETWIPAPRLSGSSLTRLKFLQNAGGQQAQNGGGGFLAFNKTVDNIGTQIAPYHTVAEGGAYVAGKVIIGNAFKKPKKAHKIAHSRAFQNLGKTSNVLGAAGKVLGVTSVITSGVTLYAEDFSYTNLAKFGINVGSLFLKANPIGLGVSLTIGVLDASGYLDEGLNYVFDE